jgi:hypothetical protein
MVKQAGGRALGEATLRGFRKEVTGVENLEIAKHHLQQGGSVLVYADHYSTLDFAIYFEIIKRVTSLDKAGAIVSMKHLDPTRGLGSKFQRVMTNLWIDSFGVTAIPMVQSYDMQHYANAREIIKDGINALVAFLSQPGNVLFVTSEGTRIKDRKLAQGERGLELILRKTKD